MEYGSVFNEEKSGKLPLDPLLEPGETNTLKFSKLHCPKMKSVYWRHFGFPTNENGDIITKQNVVCILCQKVLTNHGNTTNLRAHLQHRHKDIFSNICMEFDIKIPPRRSQTKLDRSIPTSTSIKSESTALPRKREKVEYHEDVLDANVGATVEQHQTTMYETIVPMTYDETRAESYKQEDIGEFLPHNPSSSLDVHSPAGPVYPPKPEIIPSYTVETLNDPDPYQLQDAIVNLVVNDMQAIENLYSSSMLQFVRTLAGNATLPPAAKIKSIIKELHSDKLTTMTNKLKSYCLSKPFSIGCELWSNVDGNQYISFYFYYTTEEPNFILRNDLCFTHEYNRFLDIDQIFSEFNINNCAGAVVNYEQEDFVKDYLHKKEIPVLLSYDAMIDVCLKSVFILPSVVRVFEEVKDLLMRYSMEISQKDIIIPSVCDEMPWTFYELLKFFAESVTWPDEIDALVSSTKKIVDILTPLAVSLDTLNDDNIPNASLLSPIVSKILNSRYAPTADDTNMVKDIKTTVTTKMCNFVISNVYLTCASLLDPRFHRLTTVVDVVSCVDILKTKYDKMCIREQGCMLMDDNCLKLSNNQGRKSNLELFFDAEDSVDSPPAVENNTVALDLSRYRRDVRVQLDISPLLWWSTIGLSYYSLRTLAFAFYCIPCVVNMNFKKSIKQQVETYRRRFMLSGNLLESVVFLNHNSDS